MTTRGKRGKPPSIDTKALLDQVDIVALIDGYVPLKKSGAEFEACCPFHNESTPSFKVSPTKQFYQCFGCGANGDAIKFLVEHQGLSFRDACRQLGADIGADDDPARDAGPSPRMPESGSGETPAPRRREALPRASKDRTEWVPVLPVPDDAPPPPVAHKYRGKPERIWRYLDAEGRLLGLVARFVKSTGGKEVLPLTFCRHPDTGAMQWQWISFADPRPMYGLDRLAQRPEATVLVVEGEKCADAAAEQLPDLVVVAWPGGGKAVDKVDWSPLTGRKVIGFADTDAKRERLTPAEVKAGIEQSAKPLLPPEKQPGVMAMAKVRTHVLALGGRWWDVTIPEPGAVADGWDVADAIAEGVTGEALAQWIRERLVEAGVADSESIPPPNAAGAGDEKKRAWIPGLIYKNRDLAAHFSNVHQILMHREEWRGVLAFDLHALRVVKRKPPPYADGVAGEWSDIDDARTAMWLAREYAFDGFLPSSAMVAEAVQIVGHAHAWHPVREWLAGLKWDGEKRLDGWLVKYLGAEASEYIKRVSRWWIMGAVMRVLKPGVKFDYCLVLEGIQGKGKSTVFSILGGEWFGDNDLDFTNKDSMVALGGKLIYELPELGALAKTDERRQKSFLSRQVDEYRPHYGRSMIKAPRQMVFGGSTNEWEWNKDPTGGRRFWPVLCLGDIDHAGLREVRDQLFAEAYAYALKGVRYWPTADEQRSLFDPQQLRIEQPDAFVDALHDWVYGQVGEFSLASAAFEGLKMDASKLTRDTQTRIGTALRKLGCSRFEKRNGMTRFWYKPPVKNAAKSSIGQPAQQQSGSEEAERDWF